MPSNLTRRRVLQAGGVTLVGALAGCASPGGEDEDGDDGGENGDEDDDGVY